MNERWPVRPLRAMAEVVLGRQRSPDRDQGPNMVPYLRAANVKDGRLDLEDIKSMDFSPVEQATFQLWPGDVLVSEGAGSLEAVGASAAWSGEIDGIVCFQNTLLRLRPRSGNDPRYLMWWARHAYGSRLFASIASGANIYHLGAERVRLLPAVMPSHHAQRAIADYLDVETARIDSLVAHRQAQMSALRGRLASEVDRLVLGAATERPTQPSRSFASRPVGWGETTIRHLDVDVQTGPFGSQLHADEYVEGGTPVINPMHLVDGRVEPTHGMSVADDKRRELARHLLEPGDIVVGRRGELGRVAVVDAGSAGFLCGTGSMRLRLRGSSISSAYLSMLLASNPLRAYFESASVGSTMDNLSAETLLAAPVLVPPLHEQRTIEAAIAESGQRTDGATDSMRRQINLLIARRQALITAAVNGQHKVPGVAA